MESVLFLVMTVGVLSLTVEVLSLAVGPDCDLNPLPFDCQEAYDLGCRRSGIYSIDPGCGLSFNVWCDMNNGGGGWTVFQRRRHGLTYFYRKWTEYENGFGFFGEEHWLGLKKINCLTGAKPVTQLRIDLADFEGHHKYAHYNYFSVGNLNTNYKLSVGGYSGTAGDSFTAGSQVHNGKAFTTRDRDNDKNSNVNCASQNTGAWWYDSCQVSNLNGVYYNGESRDDGVRWFTFNAADGSYSLKWSEMKLK